MKNLFTVLLISSIFVILLLTPSSAYSQLTIDLDNTGNAVFLGKTDSSFLPLPEGISIEGNNIVGLTDSLTSKSGSLWNFSFFLNESQITLVLPNGAVIEDVDGGEIQVRGSQIEVISQNSIDVTYTINQETSSSSGSIIILIIVAILIIISIYLSFKYYQKIISTKKEKLDIIKKVLNERERLILNNLEKAGKIKFNHLRKLTEIPKASFSRHIISLEKKSLIKRSGEGKNKYVEVIK